MTPHLQPPSVLLFGAPGSGKTDSLATLLAAGLELFVVITEPGGAESLLDSCTRRKIPVDKLHWTVVQPTTGGWEALGQMAQTVGTQSFEAIQNIKSGVGKDKTREPAMKLLSSFKDFKCERTGESFGDVSTWDHTRALALDSLSGLSIMSMDLTIGFKPAAHQGEWGVAMNFVEKIILKLTSDRNCFFVMTAHAEREGNEITGATQVMASTLGRKLAPKIPRFFSEVVYAKRLIEGAQQKTARFTWSTVDALADLKNRTLPIGDALPPDFTPVVAAYRKRLQQVSS